MVITETVHHQWICALVWLLKKVCMNIKLRCDIFFWVKSLLSLCAPIDVRGELDGNLRGRPVAVTIQYSQHTTTSDSVFRPRLTERALVCLRRHHHPDERDSVYLSAHCTGLALNTPSFDNSAQRFITVWGRAECVGRCFCVLWLLVYTMYTVDTFSKVCARQSTKFKFLYLQLNQA